MTLEIVKMIWEDLKASEELTDTEKADTLRGIFYMYGDIIKQDEALNDEMTETWDDWD